MTSGHPGSPIVVGIDGTGSSMDAALWAADEARRRHLPVRLVHAFRSPGEHVPQGYLAVLLDRAGTLLDQAAESITGEVSGVEVHTALRTGHPIELLVAESVAARMVVVGSRGLGRVPGLVAGSVAVGLAGRAASPVVVVRAPADARADSVLVGVDGAPVGEAAIAFAFDAASSRGTDLVALHAWADVQVEPVPDRAQWQAIREGEVRVLAERLAGWGEKYPDVRVRRIVEVGGPAHALLRHVAQAQLLVVGSRGRGGFAGLLLGSTSHAVLHRAPCPVAVIRPGSPG